MQDANHWTYKGEKFKDDDIKPYKGFVYLLTGLDGKRYLGCKRFYSVTIARKTKMNADTKRKRTKKVSDYQSYYSSSKHVKEIISEHGRDWFSREILSLHGSYSDMLYEEAKQLFSSNALFEIDPVDGDYLYLNCNISMMHFRSRVKLAVPT